VLTGIDLDIAPGQVIAITGSNGTGKSTLLNIMAGITRPTTGTVTGRPRSIGYVPERFPVRTPLSAVGYLQHMGRIRGLSADAATRRASSLMDRFELAAGDTALRQLSKGNAQRVGLIQALLVPPEVLILDEPATGMDVLGHDTLIEIVDEVARDGGAVVLGSPLHSEWPVRAVVRELSDGRLAAAAARRPTPAGSAAVQIVLRRGRHARVLPLPWSAVVAGPTGTDCWATVPAAISDRLLSAALQSGWSVISVVPVGQDVAGRTRAPDEPGDSPAAGGST
jgi:ABC-type Na+ transport system ATPase subunit NatA